MTPACCEPQKAGGVQLGAAAAGPTANRICMQQCCLVHLCGFVTPQGEKVVSCSRCYANLASSSALRGARPLAVSDLDAVCWHALAAAWGRMWCPTSGTGSMSLAPTALLGIRHEEAGWSEHKCRRAVADARRAIKAKRRGARQRGD